MAIEKRVRPYGVRPLSIRVVHQSSRLGDPCPRPGCKGVFEYTKDIIDSTVCKHFAGIGVAGADTCVKRHGVGWLFTRPQEFDGQPSRVPKIGRRD